jgi:type II secretory pathway component GspD/PulD (secretin)
VAISARSFAVLALPLLLAGTSCSLWQKGKGVIFEEEPAAAAGSAESMATGPRSLPERHPFIRFIARADGTWTAVATVPAGAGAKVLTRLKALCAMDDATEPSAGADGVIPAGAVNAKLWMEEGGGGVYLADATAKPWATPTGAAWKPVEDLIIISGNEAEVEEVLSALDLWYNSSPQIEIQATVFDVTNTDLFERGIIQANGQPILEKTGSNTFLRALGGGFPSGSNPGFGGGTGAPGLGGVFRVGFIDADFELDAYLQFLKREGVVDIVSQPSVVTRNGVAAMLDATEKIPFLKPGTVNLGGSVNYNIDYNSAGVKLNVIPFLVGEDTLHLIIHAEVSRLGRDFVVGVDASNNAITVPSTTSRVATTEVLVRSGQTVVIGGLKLKEQRKEEAKIPFLGDAPLIGWLFSNQSDDLQETEIYFVIKPIVKPVPTIERIGDIFDPFAK